MTQIFPSRWTFEPEYIDLLNYLIKETENVKCPLNLSQLARHFKEQSGAFQTTETLQTRIKRMRDIIHNFEHIDKITKVKLLFSLSAPVDANFLEELKKDASVEVDKRNRIIYYKRTDGNLELRGDHSHSSKTRTAQLESKRSLRSMIDSYFVNKDNAVPKTDEEGEMWNLIEFITEKCDISDSPISIRPLAEEFIKHFETQRLDTVRYRIKGYSREILKLESLDTHSKVRQLFCLSVPVDADYLEKLREEAVVKVDPQNRITQYTSRSLRLKGTHWGSRLASSNNSKRVMADSDDDDEEDLGSNDVITRRGRVSKKRISYSDSFKTPKSSKRKADTWGSTSSKRTPVYNPFHSFDDPQRFEIPGSIQELLNEIARNGNVEVPIRVGQEEPIIVENTIEDVKPETAHNSKLKFFEAMQSLILCLDTPSLSDLQSRIHQNIQKLKGSDEVLSNDELVPAMNLLVAQMCHFSVMNLSESVESVSLIQFLCYLKAAILNSKLTGLDSLLEKIKGLNKKMDLQMKSIPVDMLAIVLQTIMDIIGF